MPNHGLGRKPSKRDSRDYPLGEFIPLAGLPESQFWEVGKMLNQEDTPHCVGFSFANWSNCLPVAGSYEEDDAHDIYYECKAIDGQPLEENGSTIRSGAKAMLIRKRLGGYAFGSVADARAFLLAHGPVVFGIDWYEAMFYPNDEGLIVPVGDAVGGHAIMAYGADPEFCYLQNSWGEDWGDDGNCKMTWADLEKAYGKYGEACAAVEVPLDYESPKPSFWVRFLDWLVNLFKVFA